jgi:hypothetical protein
LLQIVELMVVLAVSREPLSGSISLLTGILTGRILTFWALVTHGTTWHVAQFTALTPPLRTIEAQKEQGIFSRYQGIGIPCYGFEQQKLVSFL